MNSKTKKTILLVLPLLFLMLVPFLVSAAEPTFDYTPIENLPLDNKEATAKDFYDYIQQIYNFLIGAAGVCAVLMIVIGGFMYLTSAGNNSKMEKAKEVITDAIIGLLMVMFAWLLLYLINPDLVNIKRLKNVSGAGGAGGGGGDEGAVQTTMPPGCDKEEWQTLFSDASASSGVDRCILMATAAKESGCTQVPSRSAGGRDCGVTQISAGEKCGTSCADLEANPKKGIECTAKYYKDQDCVSHYRGGDPKSEQYIKDMYAGYNGGCGALHASNDCPGQTNQYGNSYAKWDCPNNQGGYKPVPARTETFYNFYKQCKEKHPS